MSTTEPPAAAADEASPDGPPPHAQAADATSPTGVEGLRRELDEDIARIEGEIDEIDQLMEQVLVEIERHQTRRDRIAEQLASLEKLAAPDPDELTETREDLLGITRREMLFDAQRQVLEGKHRVLARFLQRLVEVDNSLARIVGGVPERPAPRAAAGLKPLAAASDAASPRVEPAAEIRS